MIDISRGFRSKAILILCLWIAGCANQAPGQATQRLQPGFDAAEYADLLQLEFRMMFDSLPEQQAYTLNRGVYQRLFRSPETGLYNRCEVYVRNEHTAVITLRGTIGKAESWIENFYAAMVKANGSLQLNDSTLFSYRLAADTQAMVHTGWLVGLASLAPYIDAQLEPLLKNGVTDMIVMGHSQGGALAFLTTSYLWYKYHLQYPALKLKTYASAAPKPGNLYYAYDFDFITANGFGFRIVNTADWVPETPVTVQTRTDFNEVNPITDARKLFRRQKFFVRLALSYLYNRLSKGNDKAMKRYRKYLGSTMYKRVIKSLPELEEPYYEFSLNYMPAGAPIILRADSSYHEVFKFDGKDMFVHHLMRPYLYLLSRQYRIR